MRISSAWMRMSLAWLRAPPRGWWIHDARVGEAAALAPGAGTEQEGAHGGGQTHTHRVNVRFDVLHGVENAEAVVDGAPGELM